MISIPWRFPSAVLSLMALMFCGSSCHSAETAIPALVAAVRPWAAIATGQQTEFAMRGHVRWNAGPATHRVDVQCRRSGADQFDLELRYREYSIRLVRDADRTAILLPQHRIVYWGKGTVERDDHLRPQGWLDRLVSTGSGYRAYLPMLQQDPELIVPVLMRVTHLELDDTGRRGTTRGGISFALADDDRSLAVEADGWSARLTLQRVTEGSPWVWPEAPGDWQVVTMERNVIERQLARGVRRALEILAPSPLLTSPPHETRAVAHGEMLWVDGQRLVILRGTPAEVGRAHGELLRTEAQRCIDSVLYSFGTVELIRSGKWFRRELESAHARLAPFIPEDHQAELRALAHSLDVDPELLAAINVFPELFHCSGFAAFGRATSDGKLYHGRVLDYMTTIGLQDAATVFIVAVDHKVPFANVGYAGFIGSVSGMNREQISLGEMGGHGEGAWDGVPMATLMRRGLEECHSLTEVQQLWRDHPRTCEYYYVFADGEDHAAVGVAATPDRLEFIQPGQTHPRLGQGIDDVVLMSAGDRLVRLRSRVQERFGKLDSESAMGLMSRPVAMSSNLHNVLFVPEDLVMYVAQASHTEPAAERPYVRYDLNQFWDHRTDASSAGVSPRPTGVSSIVGGLLGQRYPARDSLCVGAEPSADARACLRQFVWEPAAFDVCCEIPGDQAGDLLVRFASPLPTGHPVVDRVALEWFVARENDGSPKHAPAVVVVHESGRGMHVGRLMAQAIRQQGVHALLIHLPHYGVRREARAPQFHEVLTSIRQALMDVRRARDAVAALPYVEESQIALQGTSLGGFVAALAGSLDRGYHSVFLALAGGDLYEMLQEGQRDTGKLRAELATWAIPDASLKRLVDQFEPTRIAHRLEPQRTWLYSGIHDDVVPPRSAMALATAAGLDHSHHVRLPVNHYSGILWLPSIAQDIAGHLSGKPIHE